MEARTGHSLHEKGSVTQNGSGDRKHRLGVRGGAYKERNGSEGWNTVTAVEIDKESRIKRQHS